jgi:hypothetical protein
MRWGMEKRLEFIDFRLYWEGRINRKDVTDFFGISIPQASTDLRQYQEKATKNIRYDKKEKYYCATEKFVPIFTSIKAEEYLSQLQMISMGMSQNNGSPLGFIPSFYMIPTPQRSIDSEILREILRAIRQKLALEIEYQSMSRPEPIIRWVVPHALACDGYRWHVRAFCHVREEFRDFLLARMLRIVNQRDEEIDPRNDLEWEKIITVKIGPHPGLTKNQKRIIESDYGMEEGVASMDVRAALYFYLERRMGLEKGCEERSPIEQQIVMLNRREVAELLKK